MYLDFARELKKLCNMKLMMIPIVIGALGTVTKRFYIGCGGIGNKGTSGDHLNYGIIESARILRNVPDTGCQSDSIDKVSGNDGGKNSSKKEWY